MAKRKKEGGENAAQVAKDIERIQGKEVLDCFDSTKDRLGFIHKVLSGPVQAALRESYEDLCNKEEKAHEKWQDLRDKRDTFEQAIGGPLKKCISLVAAEQKLLPGFEEKSTPGIQEAYNEANPILPAKEEALPADPQEVFPVVEVGGIPVTIVTDNPDLAKDAYNSLVSLETRRKRI